MKSATVVIIGLSTILMSCGNASTASANSQDHALTAENVFYRCLVIHYGRQGRDSFDVSVPVNSEGELYRKVLLTIEDAVFTVSVGHQATKEREIQLTISKDTKAGSVSSSGLAKSVVYFDQNEDLHTGVNVHIQCRQSH